VTVSDAAGVLRHRDRIEGDLVIEVAFTDVSLSLGDAADPEVREAALRRLADATQAAPVLMHQVHGAAVHVIDGGDAGDDPRVGSPVSCDAVVTAQPGVALLARAADCVPVLLADPATGWIAAVHSGRPGLAGGVVPAAVAALRERGGDPTVAWIGPHVCGACYEVPAELQQQVAAVVPEARSTTSWGTPALDLGAGVRAQLTAAGIHDVRTVDACTREDPSWPSYRRDGAAATRFAGAIWVAR
jgi:YfiH family protein